MLQARNGSIGRFPKVVNCTGCCGLWIVVVFVKIGAFFSPAISSKISYPSQKYVVTCVGVKETASKTTVCPLPSIVLILIAIICCLDYTLFLLRT